GKLGSLIFWRHVELELGGHAAGTSVKREGEPTPVFPASGEPLVKAGGCGIPQCIQTGTGSPARSVCREDSPQSVSFRANRLADGAGFNRRPGPARFSGRVPVKCCAPRILAAVCG